MRNIIVFVFILISVFSYSQSSEDYEIYNYLINKNINNARNNKANLEQIILSNKLTKFSKESFSVSYIRDISNSKQEFIMSVQFKTNFPDSIKMNEIRNLLKVYCDSIQKEINLRENKIIVDVPHIVIKSKKIERIFRSLFYNNRIIQRQWKRFDKKYPNSYGYHEYSNVKFSESFAVVYDIWRFSSLGGNGILRIMERTDKGWVEFGQITLWNN